MWSLNKQLFNNLFFGNINKNAFTVSECYFLQLCVIGTLVGWNIYARAILAFCIPIMYTRKTCMALYMVELTLPRCKFSGVSYVVCTPLQRETGGVGKISPIGWVQMYKQQIGKGRGERALISLTSCFKTGKNISLSIATVLYSIQYTSDIIL